MNLPMDWLMSGPGWLKYRTVVDLQEKPLDSGMSVSARMNLVKDAQIGEIIKELMDWPGPAITRHNDAGHSLHKLAFLADVGMHSLDQSIDPIVQKVLQNQSAEGAFQIKINVKPALGGSGQDVSGWALCDSPSVLYSLAKMGLRKDPRIQKAAQHLAGSGQAFGWPCGVSAEMGKFRGPGRKTDPCPYATLISLKALAQIPDWKDNAVCHNGAEALLKLWDERKERKAYLFGMGTDFAKLKAPMVWYDILHVCEVLTQFDWLRQDARLLQMLDIVESKADPEGCFKAESVWKAWSKWDFGQKKSASFWITFLAHRMLKRAGR
jgi:hypothetical protein